MTEQIELVRTGARVAIARLLPAVLCRESIERTDGAFVGMFNRVLRAILAEVGPVSPAEYARVERIASAVLRGELSACGVCPPDEFGSLQRALDVLCAGALGGNTLAWRFRFAAHQACLDRWASGKSGGVLDLGELETALLPRAVEIDRRAELREVKARTDLKVASMARDLRIPRSEIYTKFLLQDAPDAWSDDSPPAQAIRQYYKLALARNTSAKEKNTFRAFGH